jgi:hypothetical protein
MRRISRGLLVFHHVDPFDGLLDTSFIKDANTELECPNSPEVFCEGAC